MAEHHLAVLRPHLEVAEPGALVDQRQQLERLAALALGRAQVERAAQLQAVALRPPGEPEFVILPVAGQGEGQVPVVGAVEGEVLGQEHVLDHVERVGGQKVAVFFGCGVVHALKFLTRYGRPRPEGIAVRK